MIITGYFRPWNFRPFSIKNFEENRARRLEENSRSIKDLSKELEEAQNSLEGENLISKVKEFSKGLSGIRLLQPGYTQDLEKAVGELPLSESGSTYENIARGWLELALARRNPSSQAQAIFKAQEALAYFVNTL